MQVQQQDCRPPGEKHHHKYVQSDEIPLAPVITGISSELALKACRYQEHPATFDFVADFCQEYKNRPDRISVFYRRVHRLYSGRLAELGNDLDKKFRAIKREMTKDEENFFVGVLNHKKNVEGGLEMMEVVVTNPRMTMDDYWCTFALNSIGNAYRHLTKMAEELQKLG